MDVNNLTAEELLSKAVEMRGLLWAVSALRVLADRRQSVSEVEKDRIIARDVERAMSGAMEVLWRYGHRAI